MTNSPRACRLDPGALRARWAELLPALVPLATARTAIHGGFRWHFESSADSLASIALTVQAERQCCPFLRFVVVAEPDGGAIVLEVTGPEGSSEFLQGLLGESAP